MRNDEFISSSALPLVALFSDVTSALLQEKMADPQILSNTTEMQRIAKAAADLEPTVQAYRDYLQATEALDEAKQLLRECDGAVPCPC